MFSTTPRRGLPLIGLDELRTLDRRALENRARELAQAVNLGDGLMLCRILGRYKLYVPAADVGFGVHVMMDGVWEGWLSVFMFRRIRPGMTVVDVGANHGYYSVVFADLVGPEGRVFAIEPNPDTAPLLRRSVSVNGLSERVTVVEAAAVAGEAVALPFRAEAGEPKNARLIPVDAAAGPGDVQVAGATLDAVLASVARVDFMKIDVEGAEEQALAGAMTVIRRDRPDILLEFNVHRCADPVGLLDMLEAIYGTLWIVTFASTLERADRTRLLDRANFEDWSLFLTVS